MKYYSEKLKTLFDTEEEVRVNEQRFEDAQLAAKKKEEERKALEVKKNAERKARAAEVDAALKAYNEAGKNFREVLNKFIKDYGAYHYSTTDPNFEDLIGSLFDRLF